MTRTVVAAMALLTLALPVAAQQRSSGPTSGRGLFAGITLSDAQQKVLDSAWTANQPMRDQMRAQMQSGERPDSAQMAKMRAMREKNAASMRAVLTPDQQKVFDKNVQDMRARMGAMDGGMRQGPPSGAPSGGTSGGKSGADGASK